MTCSVCGGPYVLVDGVLCGECFLLAYPPLPPVTDAPRHEPVYDETRGSNRWLPGFVEARDRSARTSAALARARAAREAAR